MRDAAEELEIADAHRAGDLDLFVVIHRVGGHAVDVGGTEPGVIECSRHRFAGQAQLAAPRVLGELGRADANDGRLIAQRAAHGFPSAGNATTTVPVT